jgi:alginate O-acetyltransferase complex protein AlgI
LLIARSEGVRVGDEYVVDPAVERSRRAKLLLAVSISANLSVLGFFKYFNFGVENYDSLVEWIGLPELRLDTALRVTLPLGISFYTFQSMSYTIDVYRGQARANRRRRRSLIRARQSSRSTANSPSAGYNSSWSRRQSSLPCTPST